MAPDHNGSMNPRPSRRDVAVALAGFGSVWPFNWFRHTARLGEAKFREVRGDPGARRYIWIHGDERTAGDILRTYMRTAKGRAFLVENHTRNVRLNDGSFDPNRIFSREGAGKNLRELNPAWTPEMLRKALDRLDHDRERFLKRILPPDRNELLIALHNNGPDYSVKDEISISDAVALNDEAHPDEFLLCTMPWDFHRLARGRYNVVLQHRAPQEDDGSLSRICAARNVRYVNIEAGHGAAARQAEMLRWLDERLSDAESAPAM